MPKLVHHFQVVQFPDGLGGYLGGGHPVEVADAPEPDEDHAEEVLVEDDEVAADPLRLVVQVARHLADAPEPAEGELGVLPAVVFLGPGSQSSTLKKCHEYVHEKFTEPTKPKI